MPRPTATALEHEAWATAARDRLCTAAIDTTLAAVGADGAAWLAAQFGAGAALVLHVELPSGDVTADLIREGVSAPLFSVRTVSGGNA
jgi:hypothetical protein